MLSCVNYFSTKKASLCNSLKFRNAFYVNGAFLHFKNVQLLAIAKFSKFHQKTETKLHGAWSEILQAISGECCTVFCIDGDTINLQISSNLRPKETCKIVNILYCNCMRTLRLCWILYRSRNFHVKSVV